MGTKHSSESQSSEKKDLDLGSTTVATSAPPMTSVKSILKCQQPYHEQNCHRPPKKKNVTFGKVAMYNFLLVESLGSTTVDTSALPMPSVKSILKRQQSYHEQNCHRPPKKKNVTFGKVAVYYFLLVENLGSTTVDTSAPPMPSVKSILKRQQSYHEQNCHGPSKKKNVTFDTVAVYYFPHIVSEQ
jgi:nitroreductase